MASSDLHTLSVDLGWGLVVSGVPAMATSFYAQEAIMVAAAWGTEEGEHPKDSVVLVLPSEQLCS